MHSSCLLLTRSDRIGTSGICCFGGPTGSTAFCVGFTTTGLSCSRVPRHSVELLDWIFCTRLLISEGTIPVVNNVARCDKSFLNVELCTTVSGCKVPAAAKGEHCVDSIGLLKLWVCVGRRENDELFFSLMTIGTSSLSALSIASSLAAKSLEEGGVRSVKVAYVSFGIPDVVEMV